MKGQRYLAACKQITHCSSVEGFDRFIVHSSENKQDLFQKIRTCKLNEDRVRFNVWRLELNVLSIDSSINEKIEQLKARRISYKQRYDEAFKGHIAGKGKESNIPKNPLMKAMMKPEKVETSSDEFLREEIKKDVDRTYQQMEFFQNQNILKLLSNILFIWCKRNPQVSYIQGMNEVLASIVIVYFMETYYEGVHPQGWDQASEELKETMIFFNSIEHAEADIYHVFQKIMDIQHEMFKTEADLAKKGYINPNSKNNTPILQRIINLMDHKLKSLDLELFRAIKLQDVQTKSFLLRWIRCMHTRQLSLESSFVVWDSIFLDYHEWPGSKQKSQFEFIDAMCLAMFIYMRSIVLTRETSYEILQVYQKYPQIKLGGYLEELITIAWSVCETLRNPNHNQNDWYESQSKKSNKKLEFLKTKDSSKQTELKKEKEFPKSPNALFQNKKPIVAEKTNVVVPEKIQEQPPPVKPLQEKKRENPIFSPKKDPIVHQEKINPIMQQKLVQKQIINQEQFSITLEADDWKQIEKCLKNVIQKEQNWFDNCEKSLKILQKNMEAARRKLNK